MRTAAVLLIALVLPASATGAVPSKVERYAQEAAFTMGQNAANLTYHAETNSQCASVNAKTYRIRQVSGSRWLFPFKIIDCGARPHTTCHVVVVVSRTSWWIPAGRTDCPDAWVPWPYAERDPQTRVVR